MIYYTYLEKDYIVCAGNSVIIIKLNDMNNVEQGAVWGIPCVDLSFFYKEGLPYIGSPTLNYIGLLNLSNPDVIAFDTYIFVD